MKMAKRILSLVLVLVMFASLSVTAFADTPATPYINVTVLDCCFSEDSSADGGVL